MAAAPNGRRRPRARSRAPREAKTKIQTYREHLLPLMEHIHRKKFGKEHKYTKAELKAVNPKKIIKFVKLRVYNDSCRRATAPTPSRLGRKLGLGSCQTSLRTGTR